MKKNNNNYEINNELIKELDQAINDKEEKVQEYQNI